MRDKKTGECQAHQKELTKAKETIIALRKEINDVVNDTKLLIEEAFIAGYTKAMEDVDHKADAMDKFFANAMKQFEKEYSQQMKAGTKKLPSKGKKKTSAKKKK